MKSNEHIKKFQPGEIPKCAKNQIWEAGDKNWSLGPASTGSIQKPDQPTNNINTTDRWWCTIRGETIVLMYCVIPW